MAKHIIEAIHQVMARVSGVGKTGFNSHHRYNFSSESDILEAVRPAMISQGLILYPSDVATISTQEIGKNVRRELAITYTIMHTSGEQLLMTVRAEGMDSQDKASPKAMTMGLKYAMIQLFNLPRGIDPDDHRNQDNAQKRPKEPAYNILDDPRYQKFLEQLPGGSRTMIDTCKAKSWPLPSKWDGQWLSRFLSAYAAGEIEMVLQQ